MLVIIRLATLHYNTEATVSRRRVEDAHGLKLPVSTRNIQQKRFGMFVLGENGIMDRGILSMFEMDSMDIAQFRAQLRIRSTSLPTKPGTADPCKSGWNIWPSNSVTFVPGNTAFEGLVKTWSGEAKPVEALSCYSPKGSWLHVEIWGLGSNCLVKVYTDWN
jgi:hypothetical protein